MTPLLLFLLVCAAVYFATIQSAFTALMRLSIRLLVDRNGRHDDLDRYLEDPVPLFVAVRFWATVDLVLVTILVAGITGLSGAHNIALLVVVIAAFIIVFEHVIPSFITRRDPEAVLDVLLPSFALFARITEPLTAAVTGIMMPERRERGTGQGSGEATGEQNQAAPPVESDERDGRIDGEERRLIQSIVDFGDTVVREVMTPRPDIVAIRADATIDQLRTLLREQEYSRIPVFKESLDNVSGFVFVKDLITLTDDSWTKPVTAIMRPAYFVPETKQVSALLREFQLQHMQIAIVLDEYGGTAGLVTLEDLLEEIVGEIRDEYDVETEQITDEGNGAFLFTGKVNIDEVAERLETPIEPEGFETVGGYLLSHLGRVPAVGETFDIDGLSVEVLEAERRRVNKVRIRRRQPQPET